MCVRDFFLPVKKGKKCTDGIWEGLGVYVYIYVRVYTRKFICMYV